MKSNEASNEEVRRAVLEVLASRHPAALPVASIQRRIALGSLLDGAVAVDRVEAACEFLKGLKLVSVETDGLGVTKYWSATSEGVLKWERGA